MSKNQYVEPPKEEVKQETPPKKTKTGKSGSKAGSISLFTLIRNFFNSILSGTILTKKNVVKSLPLILFITALIVIYIWNNYWADKKVREISKIKKELKELRSEHITTRSELMFSSKQSEIARRLDTTGIKESVVPPQKIFIKE